MADFAVSGRIAKEMRELQGKRAGLRQTARSKAIAKIESKSMRCFKGHDMVLRKGKGWFWGCSKFPKCRETRKLTDSEAEVMNGS